MNIFANYASQTKSVLDLVLTDSYFQQQWQRAFNVLRNCLRNGGTIYIAGNGGSAADAQHFSAELIGRFRKERHSMPAIALTTNTSEITAIGNDYGFEHIFSRQLQGLATLNDVFVGISTSGNSKNVVLAMDMARTKGTATIALTGEGGQMKELADISVAVPSKVTSHIQEIHLLVYHSWCLALEES